MSLNHKAAIVFWMISGLLGAAAIGGEPFRAVDSPSSQGEGRAPESGYPAQQSGHESPNRDPASSDAPSDSREDSRRPSSSDSEGQGKSPPRSGRWLPIDKW